MEREVGAILNRVARKSHAEWEAEWIISLLEHRQKFLYSKNQHWERGMRKAPLGLDRKWEHPETWSLFLPEFGVHTQERGDIIIMLPNASSSCS